MERWVTRLWDGLTRPRAHIPDPSELGRARVVAALSLFLAVNSTLGVLSIQLYGSQRTWPLVLAIFALGLVYLLARLGRQVVAARLLAFSMVVPCLVMAVLLREQAGPASRSLMWLTVPMITFPLIFREAGAWLAISLVLASSVLVPILAGISIYSVAPGLGLILVVAAASGLVASLYRREQRKSQERLDQLQQLTGSLSDRVERGHRALTQATDLVQAVVEASPAAVVAVDAHDRVTIWNAAAEVTLGIPRDQILGRPSPLVLADGGVIEASSQAARCRLRLDHAGILEVQVAGASLPEGAGKVWVLWDDSALRRHQELSARAERMEAVGRLAGGVAHDFNNLMAIVSAYSEELSEGGRVTDPQAVEDLQVIHEAARQAAQLTQRLMAVGRVQLRRPVVLEADPAVIDLCAQLRDGLPEDVLLDVQSHSGAWIDMDPSHLAQVVGNLVRNACQAMPWGGSVTVSTSLASASEVSDRAGQLVPFSTYVQLSVQDTGLGMTQEVLRRAFEPFFTTREVGRGVGLGLSVVEGQVQQSGGLVVAHSRVGQGTTVSAFLPAVPHTPEQMAPEGHDAVLVVRGDAGTCEISARALRRQGFRVATACSFREALEEARRLGRLSVLVAELELPDVRGPVLLERLRRGFPGLPAVLLVPGGQDRLEAPGAVQPGVVRLFEPHPLGALSQAVLACLEGAPATRPSESSTPS